MKTIWKNTAVALVTLWIFVSLLFLGAEPIDPTMGWADWLFYEGIGLLSLIGGGHVAYRMYKAGFFEHDYNDPEI